MGQKVIFMREHNNPRDKFAVFGKVTMKGKIGLIVVGHVPSELSRYTWYAIQEGPSLLLRYTMKKIWHLH